MFFIPSSFFHSTNIVCLLSARCCFSVWDYRNETNAVPVLMNITFQRQTDSMHDRYIQWWCTGGRKSEGGRDAITWSRRPVCGNLWTETSRQGGWSHAKMMRTVSGSGTNKGQGQGPECAWGVSKEMCLGVQWARGEWKEVRSGKIVLVRSPVSL